MHPTASSSRRALIWACLLAIMLGMGGCSSEAKERAAFASFLQTRIVDKPGVHVPRLTPEEEKSFGGYARHYGVIRDFNSAMDAKVSVPMRELIGKGMPRSMQDLMARRADIATLRATSVKLRSNIDAELAIADAKRAALTQPDDLKRVYDQAYARTVSDPAKMVSAFMPAVESTMASAEKMADFLAAHKDQITFRGNMLQVNDPTLLAEANQLMAQMQSKSNDVIDAQRKMNALISGR